MGSRLVGMMSAQLPNVVLRVHTDGSFGDSAGIRQGVNVLWRCG